MIMSAAPIERAKRILNDILGMTGHIIVREKTLDHLVGLGWHATKERECRERLLQQFIAGAPDCFDLAGFAKHCLANVDRSNGQWQQDLWVMFETQGMRDGFFVEFGAADGVVGSNTLMLEKDLGWRGVLCEPVPSAFAELVDSRPGSVCVQAAVSIDDRREYAFSVVPKVLQLSTISAFKFGDMHADLRTESTEITVPAIDINDLIEKGQPKENVVDYLSIDTEGGELDILKRLDFDRWRIRIVTVEHNHREKEMKEIPELMAARNFERIDLADFTGLDFWFRNKEFTT